MFIYINRDVLGLQGLHRVLHSNVLIILSLFYKFYTFHIISGTGCGGESERLEALRLAFTVLQVPPHMSEGLFKVLAAILWLGNVEFEVCFCYSCYYI